MGFGPNVNYNHLKLILELKGYLIIYRYIYIYIMIIILLCHQGVLSIWYYMLTRTYSYIVFIYSIPETI